MNTIIYAGSLFCAGIFIGWLITYFVMAKRIKALTDDLQDCLATAGRMETEKDTLDRSIATLRAELKDQETQFNALRTDQHILSDKHTTIKSQYDALRIAHIELGNEKSRLKAQVEQLRSSGTHNS